MGDRREEGENERPAMGDRNWIHMEKKVSG
jgi:hypothetical protein